MYSTCIFRLLGFPTEGSAALFGKQGGLDHNVKWVIWEAEPLSETVCLLEDFGIQSAVLDPCSGKPESGDFSM